MKIVVIDGQGGRLGQRLAEGIRRACPQVELTAACTNTAATERMLKSGVKRAATGENAILYACRRADIIAGPLGIAIADSMMGEITPRMANAVACSPAYRVLVPMNLCDTYVSGTDGVSAEALIEDAIQQIRRLVEQREEAGKSDCIPVL